MNKRAIVTGGGGFIGSYLVKKLIDKGYNVGVVDNLIRGSHSRLESISKKIELFNADVRDKDALVKVFKNVDVVFHLAAVNGTENFYNHPELVLDVGIRGALAVVEACQEMGVYDLVVASSAEVYQTPSILPTPEEIPLLLPNSINPRYSYGGSKIASELIAFNYGQKHFRKMQVFRPHNVYGPDMGWKHVIPQFLVKAMEAINKYEGDKMIPFEIKGDGSETRAFCYIDDIVDGIITMYEKGSHREIYHIGNDSEISIKDLATKVAESLNIKFDITFTDSMKGGTPRRCPNIEKMKKLGYFPKVHLEEGIQKTAKWYMQNISNESGNSLM